MIGPPQYWWTCPLCFDRMAIRDNSADVCRDRDAHLKTSHPGAILAPSRIAPYFWQNRT